ncbi:MAG: hypothetical protein WB791_01430 [Waddliaceae bacterium]
MTRCFACFLFFFFISHCPASLTVDLREPTYSEGILTTEKGGVVTGLDLRIQARKIVYTRKKVDEEMVLTIEAEGDLIVEFGDYLFIGRKIFYDIQKRKGILYDGHTAFPPWYFGGSEIYLCTDGSYVIHNGYATTSETDHKHWQIEAEFTRLSSDRYLSARNVQFRFFSLPLFWLPSFRINLDSILDSPFRYTLRFGGSQGPRIGLRYEIFSWNRWKAHLQLDWRQRRGLGGGLEIRYHSPDHYNYFHSINYVAKDTTRFNQKGLTRYRFFGHFCKQFDNNRSFIRLSYDKLSDKEMATDYRDKGLRLSTAKRTQLEVRKQGWNWILNFLARVRVNDFQTVKQELPTLSGRLKPMEIGSTGIITDSLFKTSYLELEYNEMNQKKQDNKEQQRTHDYNSPRYELRNRLYRPLHFGQFIVTPEISGLAIYYGNNQNHFDRWMTMGLFELEATTNLHRFYRSCKHVATPYLRYYYYTHPSTSPKDHFIFDIDDGWYRLNMLRFGIDNHLYTKTSDGCVCRKLSLDLFAYAFFDTETLPQTIPWAYARIVYYATARLKTCLDTAWDIQRNMLDHFNYRVEWTINTNAALALEYRHRSPFDWRKVDHTNFILDSFRDPSSLRATSLSDRRDSLRLHVFYRFHPRWAVDIHSRNGWNRMTQPSYTEFQIDLLGTFQSAWHFKLSYRHRVNEDRFFFNFSIGLRRPHTSSYTECRIPCLDF